MGVCREGRATVPVFRATMNRTVLVAEEATFLICAADILEAHNAVTAVVRRNAVDYHTANSWKMIPGSEQTISLSFAGIEPWDGPAGPGPGSAPNGKEPPR